MKELVHDAKSSKQSGTAQIRRESNVERKAEESKLRRVNDCDDLPVTKTTVSKHAQQVQMM